MYAKRKLSTHLNLVYFLCCCIVTAPEGEGGEVGAEVRRTGEAGLGLEEKAEAVVT